MTCLKAHTDSWQSQEIQPDSWLTVSSLLPVHHRILLFPCSMWDLPQPEIELVPLGVEAWSLNHWKWKWKCLSLSHIWLFVTLWTVAHHAPLFMEFSRQEYWSGLLFLFPWDLPHPGIEPRSPALQVDYWLSHQRKDQNANGGELKEVLRISLVEILLQQRKKQMTEALMTGIKEEGV